MIANSVCHVGDQKKGLSLRGSSLILQKKSPMNPGMSMKRKNEDQKWVMKEVKSAREKIK